MTEAEARARLELHAATDIEPALTTDEVGLVLEQAARADADGHAPSDPSWVPTWDLNAAIAACWEAKAAKASGSYDFTTDGNTFRRSQMVTHCLTMAARWGGSAGISLPATHVSDAPLED